MKVLPLYLPHEACSPQCVYCNQPLIVGTHEERDHWDERLSRLREMPALERWEIAFYSGTFSALPQEEMGRCFDRVLPCPISAW